MRNSLKISTNRQFTPPGSISYEFCLLGDSKVHFGFAVYEISELEHTMNSLCYCGHPTNFFTRLTIRERDICVRCTAPCIFNPLSCKPYISICALGEACFSSFLSVFLPQLHRSPVFCLLFGIRKEYRSLGKEDEPCTAFSKIVKFFQYWMLRHCMKNLFALILHSLIKINSHSLKLFFSQ